MNDYVTKNNSRWCKVIGALSIWIAVPACMVTGALLCVLAFQFDQRQFEQHPIPGMRSNFIEINKQFLSMQDRFKPGTEILLVNVGTAPNSGNGDPVGIAIGKVLTNLTNLK